MALDLEALDETHAEEEHAPLFPRRRQKEDTEMDITPMIDCVFLLLIFFTVTSTPDAQTALELAAARHGIGVSEHVSVIISLADTGSDSAAIYLSDGKVGEPLAGTPADQEANIRQVVAEGWANGMTDVLIKAEKGVRHRDVARVASAAGSVEGIRLNLAVMEAE